MLEEVVGRVVGVVKAVVSMPTAHVRQQVSLREGASQSTEVQKLSKQFTLIECTLSLVKLYVL